MTKEEAKQAMKEGHKVKHSGFTDDEWVMQIKDGSYKTEDGYSFPPYEFWRWRTEDYWLKGWSIVL